MDKLFDKEKINVLDKTENLNELTQKRSELIKQIEAIEINKDEGLVFFGRCHCYNDTGRP